MAVVYLNGIKDGSFLDQDYFIIYLDRFQLRTSFLFFTLKEIN